MYGILTRYLLRHGEIDFTALPRWFRPSKSYAHGFGVAWSGYSDAEDTQREKDAQQLQVRNLRFYPMEDLIVEGMCRSRDNFRLTDGRDAMSVWEQLVMGVGGRRILSECRSPLTDYEDREERNIVSRVSCGIGWLTLQELPTGAH
jgi:hypothetical protein